MSKSSEYAIDFSQHAELVHGLGAATIPDVLHLLPTAEGRAMSVVANAEFHTARFVRRWLQEADKNIMVAPEAVEFVERFGIAPGRAAAELLIKNTIAKNADFLGVRAKRFGFKPNGYRLGEARKGDDQAYELYAWQYLL